MPFSEYYFIPSEEMELEEGGYESFPYLVPRWSKLAGEKYGRSPAMQCLPDIQMVNRMKKEILVAAQLANRPTFGSTERRVHFTNVLSAGFLDLQGNGCGRS